jgi:YegS/Rv2252/BmrU family lipid kinase
MAKMLVIYNPAAGRGRAFEHWRAVEKELRTRGIDYEARPTQGPRDAVKIASKAQEKYTAVVGVGGDGTINEIVNGLLRGAGSGATIPLGIVPLGSGDDFAKMIPPITPIGGKAMDIPTAISKVLHGQTQLFDVGRIVGDGDRPVGQDGPWYFDNSTDVGFGALVSENLSTAPKFLTGVPAYFATIFKVMRLYTNLRLSIQLDDREPFEQMSTMAYVALGRCAAGTFWVAPEAQTDDGVFDVLIADAVGRMTILSLIPKILRGKHLKEKVIKYERARRVVIDSTDPLIVESDGELPFRNAHHLEIDILPRKLRMMV